jgi:Na+:H+ antiporter, NhaA family
MPSLRRNIKREFRAASLAQSYDALWKMPISIGFGTFVFSKALHFWINDILMTVFFLVVGMEIRREIHEVALNNLSQAALPIAAALGGAIVPALIYIAINSDPIHRHGWAVPTATDIAFAVGVLALLGRSIPSIFASSCWLWQLSTTSLPY